jgi:hypothetical protein
MIIRTKDMATPGLKNISEGVQLKSMLKVGGRSLAELLKKHFIGKQNTEPNKLQGRRTNFWRAIADSVTDEPLDISPTRVAVGSTDERINQKIYGGPIPRTGVGPKKLTIPVHPMAYGRLASTFGDSLEFGIVKAPDGKSYACLFVKQSENLRREWSFRKSMKEDNREIVSTATWGDVMYKLVSRVRQKPWPNTLPSESDMTKAIDEGIQSWFRTLAARNMV